MRTCTSENYIRIWHVDPTQRKQRLKSDLGKIVSKVIKELEPANEDQTVKIIKQFAKTIVALMEGYSKKPNLMVLTETKERKNESKGSDHNLIVSLEERIVTAVSAALQTQRDSISAHHQAVRKTNDQEAESLVENSKEAALKAKNELLDLFQELMNA